MARCDEYFPYWEGQYAQAYASGKRFWRAKHALTLELISLLDRGVLMRPPARVLEVGCGDGLNSLYLARLGYDVTAIDISAAAITRAKRLVRRAERLSYVCGDVTTNSLPINGPYDLWIDVKTLHCLWEDSEWDSYFNTMRRMLRPGGQAYFNVGLALSDVRQYFPEFFKGLPQDIRQSADMLDRDLPRGRRTGIRCETLDYLCGAFQDAGFEICRAGCAVGEKCGWGAIVLAQKPKADSSGGRRKTTPWKPYLEGISSALQRTAAMPGESPTYLCICELNVEAYESRIYEVIAFCNDERLQALPDPFVLKRSRSDSVSAHFGDEARLLQVLYSSNRSVPAVLGRLVDQPGLLLEWRGPETLADRLKRRFLISSATWRKVLTELAMIHLKLAEVLNERDIPAWRFSWHQRVEMAQEGLAQWADWLKGQSHLPVHTDYCELCVRLSDRLAASAHDTVIWGDCNPKNIVMNGEEVCFIDPHPKRGEVFFDLVLLFTFADAPETYVPRTEALEYLGAYWQTMQADGKGKLAGLDDFKAAYDDELLWRLLVYGGNLLDRKDSRLDCWQAVCMKMQPDLLQLLEHLQEQHPLT